MGDPAPGALGKFAVDTALPFDASSKAIELILPENLKRTDTIRRTDGLRGTRSRHHSRRRKETRAVGGSLTFHPGVAELDLFLPLILGGTTALGVTALAETVPAWYAMIDRVTKVFTYSELKVNSARLAGATGQPVTLTLEVEGKDESVGNAGTFPAITIPDEPQFIFPHASVSINSVAYEMNRFELLIDNMLDTGRYMNATTRSKIVAQDRLVQLSLGLAYTADETALYDMSIDGLAGALTLDDGVAKYDFAFANLFAPTETPTIQSKTEILFPLVFTSERTDSTAELIVTKV